MYPSAQLHVSLATQAPRSQGGSQTTIIQQEFMYTTVLYVRVRSPKPYAKQYIITN